MFCLTILHPQSNETSELRQQVGAKYIPQWPSELPPGSHTSVWSTLPRQQWEWLTHSCQRTTASRAPSNPKHTDTHTPNPLQAVIKTGKLALNNPVRKPLWMVNHREFPLNSRRYGGERSGRGVGVGRDPSVRKKERKRRKERDGQAVGLVVQQRRGAPTAWA